MNTTEFVTHLQKLLDADPAVTMNCTLQTGHDFMRLVDEPREIMPPGLAIVLKDGSWWRIKVEAVK